MYLVYYYYIMHLDEIINIKLIIYKNRKEDKKL